MNTVYYVLNQSSGTVLVKEGNRRIVLQPNERRSFRRIDNMNDIAQDCHIMCNGEQLNSKVQENAFSNDEKQQIAEDVQAVVERQDSLEQAIKEPKVEVVEKDVEVEDTDGDVKEEVQEEEVQEEKAEVHEDIDYSEFTKDELEYMAKEQEIYDSIEGTGADGNILKSDLINALE